MDHGHTAVGVHMNNGGHDIDVNSVTLVYWSPLCRYEAEIPEMKIAKSYTKVTIKMLYAIGKCSKKERPRVLQRKKYCCRIFFVFKK